jgi:hypothetical protein
MYAIFIITIIIVFTVLVVDLMKLSNYFTDFWHEAMSCEEFSLFARLNSLAAAYYTYLDLCSSGIKNILC